MQVVPLIGKYWTHEGLCGVPPSQPHIHYGQNVVLHVPEELLPLIAGLRGEVEALRFEIDHLSTRR